MRNSYLLVAISPLLFLGCINEDFKDTFSKTVVTPEYSVPLGTTEYILETDFTGAGSTVPGIYGTIYYNDNPYPLNVTHFVRNNKNKFNINYSNTIRKNIESLTFHVIAINSFPTDIETQIYFLDPTQNKIFQAYQNGPLLIKGGKTNSSGRVIEPNKQLTEVTLNSQQIDQLDNIAYFNIESVIKTQKADVDTARFYLNENVTLIVGVRVKLKIIANEL